MNNRLNRTNIRWTADELRKEIARIERLLTRGTADSPHGHCARAYLEQVLKDRRSTLKMIEVRDAERQPEPERTAPAPTWPTPPAPRPFRALLQV